MAGNSTEPGRSVTSKVAAILMSFTNGRGHALVDLARQAGLPTSTAHRLARELADRHLLERTDDGEFRVGLPLRMLCGEVAERPTLRERAPFIVDDLCEATRTPARLGVLDDLEVAYIERLPGYRPVSTFSTAARLPVHATALGKALLAFAPSQVVRMVLTPALQAYTTATLTTPEQLHRALQCVRLHGMATSCGELQAGHCGVAVPVPGPCGTAIAAVGVDVADLEPATLGRVVPALVLAARGLARELAVDPRERATAAARERRAAGCRRGRLTAPGRRARDLVTPGGVGVAQHRVHRGAHGRGAGDLGGNVEAAGPRRRPVVAGPDGDRDLRGERREQPGCRGVGSAWTGTRT